MVKDGLVSIKRARVAMLLPMKLHIWSVRGRRNIFWTHVDASLMLPSIGHHID